MINILQISARHSERVTSSNLDKNQEIIDGLDPADKEMFENLETKFATIRKESKEIFDNYRISYEEHKKLDEKIPDLENNYNALRESLENDVSKIKSMHYRPNFVEVDHLSYFEEQLNKMKAQTKDAKTIEGNYQKTKNAYDNYEKTPNGQCKGEIIIEPEGSVK